MSERDFRIEWAAARIAHEACVEYLGLRPGKEHLPRWRVLSEDQRCAAYQAVLAHLRRQEPSHRYPWPLFAKVARMMLDALGHSSIVSKRSPDPKVLEQLRKMNTKALLKTAADAGSDIVSGELTAPYLNGSSHGKEKKS